MIAIKRTLLAIPIVNEPWCSIRSIRNGWSAPCSGVVGKYKQGSDFHARRVDDSIGIQLHDLIGATRVAKEIARDRPQIFARSDAMDGSIESKSVVDLGPSPSARGERG